MKQVFHRTRGGTLYRLDSWRSLKTFLFGFWPWDHRAMWSILIAPFTYLLKIFEIIQDGGRRHLEFARIENSAIRSAVPENPTL